MEPIKVDFSGKKAVKRGTYWPGFMFTLHWDVNGVDTDQVPNISGAEMHIRKDYGVSPALKKITLGSGIVVEPTTPFLSVKIEGFTAELVEGNHKWDILLTFSDGTKMIPYAGAYCVPPSITVPVLP